jgi:intergrase/recombinase
MGKPETVDGDNEIISKIVKYPEFQGINWYVTAPHETNKNAIVERFIKTLKNFILKTLIDPNVKFSKTVDLTTKKSHHKKKPLCTVSKQ